MYSDSLIEFSLASSVRTLESLINTVSHIAATSTKREEIAWFDVMLHISRARLNLSWALDALPREPRAGSTGPGGEAA